MGDDAVRIPPPPRRVARRALALSAVACRGFIENAAGQTWAQDLHKEVLEWVVDAGVMDEFESWEMSLIRSPLGELTSKEKVDAGWLSEGLAVLAWALGDSGLPPHDEMVDPKAVADRLGFLSVTPGPLLASPSFRCAEEIHRMGERLFALHWRLRDFSLNRKALDLMNVARNPWMGEAGLRQLPLIDGDLSIRGVPIAKSPEKDWRTCLSIAMERHRAVNWLAGHEPVYSEVATDT